MHKYTQMYSSQYSSRKNSWHKHDSYEEWMFGAIAGQIKEQELEEQRRIQRRENARQKGADFLAFAGGIGLHPLYYADWLVSYLRGGGVASKTPESFPYDDHDSGFKTNGYWLLTNPEVMAADMPAGYGSNRMHVFALEQPAFVRQLKLVAGTKIGRQAPYDAAREHHAGPFFKSGIDNAYGHSTVYFLDEVEVLRKFHKPIYEVVGRTTRQDQVKLHQDIVPLAYEAAGSDPNILRQLDMIMIDGSNRNARMLE